MPPRYGAFLSYSHRDAALAARLHRRLEAFRVPAPLRSETLPQRVGRVFRDREELASSARLSDSIEAALEDSAALVVLCSPAAVASRWVGQEIRHFRQRHPQRPVLAFVVAGDPGADPRRHPESAALPLELLLEDIEHPEGAFGEPLAADARRQGDGFSAAFLKLVAGLLGLPYDALRRRQARQRRQRFTLMLIASLALTFVFAWLAFDATRARNLAQQAQARAELELQSERQTRGFLLSVFDLANAETARGREPTVREVLDRAVARIDTTPFARPAIKARFLATLGQAYSSLGLFRRSAELLRDSLAQLPDAEHGEDARMQRSDARIELADVHFAMGEYDAALALLEPLRADPSLSPEQRAQAANVHGDVLSYTERDAAAQAAFEEALAALDQAALPGEEDATLRARSLSGLALLAQVSGDAAAAAQHYVQAVDMLEKSVGELHPATISTILSAGSSAYTRGDATAARANWERALALARRVYDEDSPEIGTIKNNLGLLALEAGRFTDAEPLLRDALASDRKHRSEGFDDLAFTLKNLALTRLFQGDAAEAAQLLEEALPIAQASGHATLPMILVHLAEIACRAGDAEKGRELAAHGWAVAKDALGEDHWQSHYAALELAACEAAAGRGGTDEKHSEARRDAAALARHRDAVLVHWGESGAFSVRARELAKLATR